MSQGNPEAGDVEEGAVGGEQVLMTNQQATELPQPRIGPLHDPAAFIPPQFASILEAPTQVVLPIGCDQLNASLLQALPQRVRVVGPVGDYALRLLSRTAFSSRDADFGERAFRKRSFSRRGAFQPNSQRNTLTVDQYHPLRSLAPLGFADRSAPFLAAAKLPSRNVSSHFSNPASSSPPSSARHACNHTPSSSHRCNRRQQVEGEGYSSGRKRQAAPVCRIHRMPSKQPRFDAQGRPRWSRLRFGGGNIGSTSSHCSSVISFCRFFMPEAHQSIRLIRKCLL